MPGPHDGLRRQTRRWPPKDMIYTNMNTITLVLRATEFNGWPKVKIFLGGTCLFDKELSQEFTSIDVLLNDRDDYIKVERYGKTHDQFKLVDGKIVEDQILEIYSLVVDGVKIPDWFKYNQSYIEFDNIKHSNSTVLGPNGFWTLQFKLPFITFLLDKKIEHEAKYNHDYIFPWAYKLGPESVQKLSKDFATVKELIDKHL